MRYGEFVFYNTDNLSIDEKTSMFIDCRDISYEWHADTLDCSVSLSRRHFDCTFEEILTYLKEGSKVVVIDRGPWNTPRERWHFEIGFYTMVSSVDYFLFIRVDREKMPSILEKYQLDPMP